MEWNDGMEFREFAREIPTKSFVFCFIHFHHLSTIPSKRFLYFASFTSII